MPNSAEHRAYTNMAFLGTDKFESIHEVKVPESSPASICIEA